ncbi:bifunctional DNA primase/polymerase [Rhodococcus rhodochrous]|uniref:bifunctional DNA primase/polymerase n=1 Tax=Rhodococcus rhodochrous TaxID=1829 RepID=UPI001E3FC9B3|nr:bifunctional DNA primase/polymerase [Rhodococcus rhodochrous]MCB8912061.1 bifunctional DNA primase/polymerase [Rhodococcus rhodochrous]
MTGLGVENTRQGDEKATHADPFAGPDDLGPSRADVLTKLLASVPTTNDDADLTTYLRALTTHGLAVLFIAPGQKTPVDMRSPKERREADETAQEAAKAAGRADWTHAKAPAGVHLASSDPEVLEHYLAKYRTAYGDRPVNLAVAVGPSRLVIVDADTASQLDAFLTDAGMVGEPPTVRSPGAKNADGTWVHSDGGHYWFALEDGDELPTDGTGSVTATGDYAVLWRDRYVLIPPSVRPEGEYTVTGRVHALPESVRATIAAAVTTRLEARERASVPGALADDIDAWAESVPWADILEPRGWTLAARPDRCGCDTWTAPGEHASPKSATTHETGCTLDKYTVVNAPMHIWTDNPGDELETWISERGTKTLSKLQTVAALYFDGDVGAMMEAQGLTGKPYAMTAPEGKTESGTEDDDNEDARDVVAECYYPAEFWESRESLRRIRDLSLAYRAAPEATLGAVMARLSAHLPPSVEVDTGIASPVPMNMVVAVTSRSGKGKTSVLKASKKIVEFELSWSMDPLDLDAAPVKVVPGEDFPHEGKIGSGEGIAEMYWGRVTESDPNSKRDRVVRRRVRSNALMVTDEGSGLVRRIQDEKSTVGETVREAWSRAAIGQSNGTVETYRYVPEGSYSLGVLVGFQLSVAAGLLGSRELIEGTPQRFLFTWCKPNPEGASRERVRALGKQWRSGDLTPLAIVVPHVGLRVCETLAERIDSEHYDNWLSDDDDESVEGDLRSQRPAMLARTAGFLAIIDGRTETDEDGYLVVTEEDWALAEIMFERSCAIADLAISDRRKRDAIRKRRERAQDLADRIEDEELLSTDVGRAKGRILGRLTGAGQVKWSGKDGVRTALFNNSTVKDGDAALAELVESGRVRRTTIKRSEYVELVA